MAQAEASVTREIRRWLAESEAILTDTLCDVDWDMFRNNSSDYGGSDVLTDSIIPKVIVPNQKLRVDRTVCVDLKARTAVYNEGLISGDKSRLRPTNLEVL